MNYVATYHKPTKVTHSCVGNFTSMEYSNLILAKCNRLEIHQITSDGIELISDVPINGRIVCLELFHPRDGPLDLLFILTENYKTCVLQWDVNSSELSTRSASMDITAPKCKKPFYDQICTIDPDCRVIGLFLCMRLCKVVPLDKIGQLEKPFDFKLQVKDIKFLYGCEVPTVAVLCQDVNGAPHAKMYEVVSQKSTDLATGTWSLDHLDCGAGLLIPVPTPLFGFLIIGEKQAVYCSANTFVVISKPHFTAKAYERVNGSRFLLGDGEGRLHLLVVQHKNQRVYDLTFWVLGNTSITSTISYLGNSLVFVGSSCGDSQLIKVDLDAQGSGIQVLKRFVNLGPIHDLCLVDLEKHGQNQIVTCSGGSKDGSLRIVSKGINEQASVELEGILGLWSLKSSVDEASSDTFLVVSFITETLILAMNPENELEEIEIKGFLSQVQTLFCHDAVFNQLVQVTSSSIRLVSSTTRELRDIWNPPDGLTINIATANASQVLLATEERHLFFIEVGDGTLRQVSRTRLDHETSCLNIYSIEDKPIALVGKWTSSMEIRNVPCLTLLIETPLGNDIFPRSVLLSAFEGILYLLCGLGDGNLIIFQLDKITGDIVDTKRVSLGTQPISLHTFSWENANYVFAASDRPTTIYIRNKQLFINALDLGDVTHMCEFNLAAFPDSIAIATRDKLTIGSIDPTQKFHIRTIPLGESVRCICHQTQTSTYGVCTTKNSDMQFVRLFDAETFNALSVYKLRASESGEFIVSCLFTGDTKEYYCVGTKSPIPCLTSETEGRLLVFSVENGQLRLIFEKETVRGVNSLKSFGGKLLASWGNTIQLYKWTRPELQPECSHSQYQTSLATKHVQTHGNLVVTADEVDIIRICVYKPGGKFENQAWYCNEEVNEIVAVQILDSSVYLTGDNLLNLCTMAKNPKYSRLELVGQYHLGDCVNIFCRLVDSRIIFGTSSGMLGVIVSLTTEQYELLDEMQMNMRSRIADVGGLSHEEWRSTRCLLDTNFIDGDMIESFLELNNETKEKIANDVSIPLEQLCEMVEELKRLH